jgi:peptidoglycan/xylan/chitin deacetylase (PgdA/CDA1 family)
MALTRRAFLKTTGMAALSLPFLRIAGAGAGTVPVLLYHDISDLEQGPYTLSPSLFASQMEWLFSEGYRVVPVRELGRLAGADAGRTVVITFDDGYASFLDHAFPVLSYYRFPATINIVGAWTGSFVETGGGLNRPLMSWDEYRYLLATGLVDLGCHSFDLHHPGGVPAVPEERFRQDIRRFQETMERETGRTTDILAWPYGIYDRNGMDEAREAGFHTILTSNEGFFAIGSRLDEVPRLNIGGRADLRLFRRHFGETS